MSIVKSTSNQTKLNEKSTYNLTSNPKKPSPNLHAVAGSNGRCMGNAREGTNHLYYKGKKERRKGSSSHY